MENTNRFIEVLHYIQLQDQAEQEGLLTVAVTNFRVSSKCGHSVGGL